MLAYGNRPNAMKFARANNSNLLRALKHLMETRLSMIGMKAMVDVVDMLVTTVICSLLFSDDNISIKANFPSAAASNFTANRIKRLITSSFWLATLS